MIGGFGELRLLAPRAHQAIGSRVFANRNAFMRQVRDLKKQIILLPFSSGRLRI